MDGTIEHLGARFGGAAAWARSMGWTDEDQEHLISRLVDRAGVPLPDAA